MMHQTSIPGIFSRASRAIPGRSNVPYSTLMIPLFPDLSRYTTEKTTGTSGGQVYFSDVLYFLSLILKATTFWMPKMRTRTTMKAYVQYWAI